MKAFLVLSLVALCGASPLFSPFPVSYHAQDELGQYSYGYDGGPSAKHEMRTADGITKGGYSYLDSHGLIQSAAYVSDPFNGFRVAATNLPVGPVVPDHRIMKRSVVWPYTSGIYAHHYLGGAPLHIDGTVADTPAVTAAKLNHIAAKINHVTGHNEHIPMALAPRVYTHGGAPLHLDGTVAETPEVSATKLSHFLAHGLRAKRGIYWNHLGAPLNPDGTVADTPEVAAAKVAHFAAKAHAGTVPLVYSPHVLNHGLYHGLYHGAAPLHIDGTVADTPAVAVAKAAHFAAHAHALTRHRRWAPLNFDGTVADTPAVTAAKINHFAAHANEHVKHQATLINRSLYYNPLLHYW